MWDYLGSGGFPFNINSAIDRLLKKEFDEYRESGRAHALMSEAGRLRLCEYAALRPPRQRLEVLDGWVGMPAVNGVPPAARTSMAGRP